MNSFKKTAVILIMASAFSLSATSAYAKEEAGSAAAVSTGPSAIIAHIEKAQVEISKSDFSAAQIHLKAARTASELIAGNSEAAKKAHAVLIQGQILAKKGDVSKSTEELNKAIALYKAL